MSMKNSNETIGNRTRDLLTCSAVPQPTALQRAPPPVNKACAISCLPHELNDSLLVTRHFVSNLGPFHFLTSQVSKSPTIELYLLGPWFVLLQPTHEDQVRLSKATDLLSRKLNSHWLSWLKLAGSVYRGADKSLARPGRKQATAAEDFEFHISYL
jgi:hypothetical protein